jgi:hypothetical protein
VKAFIFAAMIVLAGSTPARAAEITAPKVSVTFVLPDGSSRSTSLTDVESRQLLGETSEYTVEWWVRAARAKLSLPGVILGDDGSEAKSAVSVASGTSGGDQTWTLPNAKHDIPHISVAYERSKNQ